MTTLVTLEIKGNEGTKQSNKASQSISDRSKTAPAYHIGQFCKNRGNPFINLAYNLADYAVESKH